MFLYCQVVFVQSLGHVRLFCDPMNCIPARPLCPWDFPGKNTEVGCRFLLQGIFPTQGSNPHLLFWQANFFTTEIPGSSLFLGRRNLFQRFIVIIYIATGLKINQLEKHWGVRERTEPCSPHSISGRVCGNPDHEDAAEDASFPLTPIMCFHVQTQRYNSENQKITVGRTKDHLPHTASRRLSLSHSCFDFHFSICLASSFTQMEPYLTDAGSLINYFSFETTAT